MTSENKRRSNKRNAQKSTGPRTQRGKDHSSLNAVTHGFFSPRLLPFENLPDAKRKIESLWAELEPRGEFAMAIFSQLVGDLVRLDRLNRAEHASLESLMRDTAYQRAPDGVTYDEAVMKVKDLNEALSEYVLRDGKFISATRIEWFRDTIMRSIQRNYSLLLSIQDQQRTREQRNQIGDKSHGCSPDGVTIENSLPIQPESRLSLKRTGPDTSLLQRPHSQNGSAESRYHAPEAVVHSTSPAASPAKSLAPLSESGGNSD